MLLLSTIFITLLLSEALTQIKLMHIFRTTRYYVFKYLAVNKNNKTLETYLLKRFFPSYIALLCICLVLSILINMLYVTISIVSIAFLVRLYNRSIFSGLWLELSRIK